MQVFFTGNFKYISEFFIFNHIKNWELGIGNWGLQASIANVRQVAILFEVLNLLQNLPIVLLRFKADSLT
ncbi:MAG: hypothetical protein HC894_10625 [Microcoleus sp. SM1_3_4]|nr:hypothetical protein [Microcoleus sp. SM1_3_4]